VVKKRKRGRPHASQQPIGREGIIASARALLERLPPHQVTIVRIAREAGVDPALVRYYFSSREELLLSVVENILNTWTASHTPSATETPAEQLAAWIRGMIDFAGKVRSMQRLMIDECAEAESPRVRKRVRELNARAVQGYAKLFDPNRKDALAPADPLLVYIAVIGMSEFFFAGQPMIQPLLPKKTSARALAERYKEFVVGMVLNGLKGRRG
jgi:AcrR family transcriptional regulator